MLNKLFELNTLKYDRLLRLYYKKLKLDEKNLLALIAILDYYSMNKTINAAKIARESNFSVAEIENTLAELLNLDYLEIYMDIDMQGRQIEVYRINPLFMALDKAMSDATIAEDESDISKIINRIESACKRPLSASELSEVTGWVSEGFSIGKINDAINKLDDEGRLKVVNVSQALYKHKTPTAKSQSKGNIKRIIDMVEKR